MTAATSTHNIATVQALYAAFGRGDIAYILERVAENVDWNNKKSAAGDIPWNGNFSGRKHVPDFFTALAQNTEFSVFEPKDYLQNDRQVAVRLRIELTVKKNDRKIASDVMHLWTFDDKGMVTAYRRFNDTAAEAAAWWG